MNSNDVTYGATPKRFQMPVCDKVISSELSEDYTLPDYQPEIRRVLRIDTFVLPPAKYIGGGRAEFNGAIDYQLLYIGADGELYSAPLSGEYSFSVPLELSGDFDLGEGIMLIADTREENVTVRVSAPRKLNVKCRLSSHVRAYGMMIADERVSGETDSQSVERLMGNEKYSLTLAGQGDKLELSDEILMSAGSDRVISASADVRINSIAASEGEADCRGEVELRLLVCRDGVPASTEMVARTIPFEQRVEVDDLTPQSFCRVRCCVSDLTVNVGEGKIDCTLGVISQITAHKETEVDFVRDIYSTKNYCESAYREYALPVVTYLPRGNFSHSERIPLGQTNIPSDAHIVEVRCKPLAEKLESDKGRCVLAGQCKYSFLLESGGEYSVSDIMLPFRYELSADIGEARDFDADVRAIACRGRVDGDNLGVDAELEVDLSIPHTESVTAIAEVRFGEEIERTDGDMVICYPEPDDTVWSIAKKYFVRASDIPAPVGLTDELGGVSYLIINQ